MSVFRRWPARRWLLVSCLGLLIAAAPAGSPAGMNEQYQPTYDEFVVRTQDGTEPIASSVGGPSAPVATIVTQPAAEDVDFFDRPVVHIPVGGAVTFDAAQSTARRNDVYGADRVVAWIWDFQDGAQANAPVVRHRFDVPGVRRVTLVVHDDTGFQTDATVYVAVGELECGSPPQEVFIPTEGGLVMHGWVTVPAGPGPFPTVLEYGPYVATQEDPCTATVLGGTARARVAAPGRGLSTGDWDMFGRQTQRGGFDAVEWFAAQPWSNGKVGLYGLSGPGVAGLLTAGSHPPHLTCAAIMTSYADFYRDMVTSGGIPNSNTFVNTWLHTLTVQDAQTVYADNTLAGVAGPLPGIGPEGEVVDHGVVNTFRAVDMVAHPYYDDWWQERNIVAYPPPDVPILYYGNQRDLWPRSTVELAKWLKPGGGRVVLLHGGHGAGDTSGWQRPRDNVIWFDWCLNGVDNGAGDRPFVMTEMTYGGDAAVPFSFGRWEALDGFLTDQVEPEQLYLRAAGDDPASMTHHGLTPEPPDAGEIPSLLTWSPVQGATAGTTEGTANQTAGLQGSWESTSLVFETPVLGTELPVDGPVTLQLYAQLLAPDLGFMVHVNDVWPDGTSHNISQGALLASHRALDDSRSQYLTSPDGVRILMQPYHPHTQDTVETLSPTEVYRFDIEIWGIANAFRPGHRLRLVLAAQDVGWRTHAEPGHAALVYSDADHPSVLNLPLLPASRSVNPFPFTGAVARPASPAPAAGAGGAAPGGDVGTSLPATGGGAALTAVVALLAAAALRRRPVRPSAGDLGPEDRQLLVQDRP